MNYIYMFTNLINGKKYVGSTTSNPKRRKSQHLHHAASSPDKDPKANYPLYCAIRKYGEENFSFDVLEKTECSLEELQELEKSYILQYDCLAPNGYNQTLDTARPRNDPRTYKKISETKRNNAKRVAEVDSDLNILQVWRCIADCHDDTEIDINKIGAVCRGERKSVNCGRVFYWLDDSDQLIIPEYNYRMYKGEPGTTQIQADSKAVKVFNKDTLEFICEYSTIALAGRELKIDPSGISKCCRGKRHHCGEYIFKYANADVEYEALEEKKFSKSVRQIDILTNKVIKEYSSLTEAAEAVGGNRSNISKCCTGQFKTCKGFKWEFVE